jgi:predicted RNA-binding protein Jag
MSDEKVITFGKEADDAQTAAYKEKIAKAKGGVHALKESVPLGGVKRPSIPVLERPPKADDVSPFTEEGGVQPRPPGSPLLRPETAKQLQDLANAQVSQQKAVTEEKAAEEKKDFVEDLFDSMDFGGRNEAERILNNKKRRQEIEARCEEMSIEDLIMTDEVRQKVIIVPGKFEVEYRSMTPDESLYIKKLLSKETNTADTYIMEKYGLLQLACCVVSINGKALPPHLNKDGDVDEETFKSKLRLISRKSTYVIADLGINYMWFDLRVRRLFNPEKMGNG